MERIEKLTAYMRRKYGRDRLRPEEASKELLMDMRLVERERFIGRLDGLDVESVARYIVTDGMMRRHL